MSTESSSIFDILQDDTKVENIGIGARDALQRTQDALTIELDLLVDHAIARTRQFTQPLIDTIEERHPGHLSGQERADHMDALSTQAYPIAQSLGLDPRDTQALRASLALHDVGRHVEAHLGADILRKGDRHGAMSAWLLYELNALSQLPHDIQYSVLYSTFWHSEKQLPQPPDDPAHPESRAYELCYALRDADKVQMYCNPEYAPVNTPEAIYQSPERNS
jgi:hypothetical protein